MTILTGMIFPMELKEATLSVPVTEELCKIHSPKPDDWYDGYAKAIGHASTDDFIAFAKDEYGLTVKIVKSDNPDTFESLFNLVCMEK